MSTQHSEATVKATVAGPFFFRTGPVAWLIFVLLLVVYQSNGEILPGNDAKPNVYLAAGLLEGRGLAFHPDRAPFMFIWSATTQRGVVPVEFDNWSEHVGNDPKAPTYGDGRRAGAIKLRENKYYVVRSVHSDANNEAIYVNTFGVGAAMTAVPVFAAVRWFAGPLLERPAVMWCAAKFVASALVAGSAAFIFLTASAYTSLFRSALIALAYGLATCVWSISSQTLWQHGPNEFFLALGTLCLSRVRTGDGSRNWIWPAGSGLAYSAAMACRPSSVIVLAAVGLYLAIAQRRALLFYVLASLPLLAALAVYNSYYLGSPISFGQASAGTAVALEKTGFRDLWQTPFWLGAAGLLISPSRGLLAFSPIMMLAAGGLVQCWRHKQYAFLRPLVIALAALLTIAFKWFDWWGGWCFGYRPIVDTMPILAVLMIPVIDAVFRHKIVRDVAGVLLAWSILVQALGAFGYSVTGWNSRSAFIATVEGRVSPTIVFTRDELQRLARQAKVTAASEINMDIDQEPYRHRLWSVSDSQILYLLTHFGESRDRKRREMADWLHHPST